MKSLAGTVSRWHLSGQAGLEGESNAQVDEEKDLWGLTRWQPRITDAPKYRQAGNQCLSSLAEAWAKVQPRPSGSGEAQASSLSQTEALPWGLDTEPGQLNENQTMSGLRKKIVTDFWKMYLMKEMSAVKEVLTLNAEKEVLANPLADRWH